MLCANNKERANAQVPRTSYARAANASSRQCGLPDARRVGYGGFVKARPAAVAGTFYPADPGELARVVDGHVAAAGRRNARRAKALIVPHAGYIYSGPIAGSAFARIGEGIERVVLIGPAHRMYVDGVAHPGASCMATPLGDVEIEMDALDGIAANPQAHAREHCLEVMLPFLQRLAPRARIIPIIGSHARPDEIGALLERWWGGPETLVVISSDLSHYESYDAARVHDRATADRICALDSTITGEDACGAIGIDGLLWLARRKNLEVELLDLRNSGDTAGRRNEVVGYGAFAVLA